MMGNKPNDKYIKLNPDKAKEIAAIKGISERSVRNALNFVTNSNLAILIRAWALNNGGKLYEAKEVQRKARVL